MRVARGPKSVWAMLLLPPLTLAALIIGYVVMFGLSPGDPATEAAVRSAHGPIIIVNHLALFALLWVLLRRNGEDLADIGWSAKAVDSSLLREFGIGVACGVGLPEDFLRTPPNLTVAQVRGEEPLTPEQRKAVGLPLLSTVEAHHSAPRPMLIPSD